MSPDAIDLFLNVITIFVLAIFIGFEVISKVPSLLHTPLMSGSNAISGITIVGAILAVGLANDVKDARVHAIVIVIALLALAFATINVVGGFVVTHRMLGKFRSGRTAHPGGAGAAEGGARSRTGGRPAARAATPPNGSGAAR